MKTVAISRFETDLMKNLHFLFRRAPKAQVVDTVLKKSAGKAKLSPEGFKLIEDTVVKGCVLLLSKNGGWRKDRFLRNNKIKFGRLWQRDEPKSLGLQFSRSVVDFLVGITQDSICKEMTWEIGYRKLNLADQLFFYYVFYSLLDTPAIEVLSKREPFMHIPLIRLAFPEQFEKTEQGSDYSNWVTGLGASILEALQPELTKRWVDVESTKGSIVRWETLAGLGRSQELTLNSYLTALEKAERLDLANFLLEACSQVVTPTCTPQMWVHDTVKGAAPRMADRTATQMGGTMLLRQLERFKRWDTEARMVAHFDTSYAASQLYKDKWEAVNGNILLQRAQKIIAIFDPIKQVVKES